MIQNPLAYDQNLIQQIKFHEGKENFQYLDSRGYSTIGYGRCIDKRRGEGLTDEECEYLLKNDLVRCEKQLQDMHFYAIQDDVRKGVLIELNFELGLEGLLEFHDMIDDLTVKDYTSAAKALCSSEWAKQVQPRRVSDMKFRLLTGKYE